MDSFIWREDPTIHGSARNVVEPALTFEVLADGSVSPYVPTVLRFREQGLIRPVAPFFEVWATVVFEPDDPEVGRGEFEQGMPVEVALTEDLLVRAGGGLDQVAFGIRVANRKAARRTNDESNMFEAAIEVKGDDFSRHQLLASTTPVPGGQPLVVPERPIPLGWFQVIRPRPSKVGAADLGVLRVRVTPGVGQVFGPVTAVRGRDGATNRSYEIVPVENRILSSDASWLRYDGSYSNTSWVNPEPGDTYDGADQNALVAWGVVDDTCDGIVTVMSTIAGRRFVATARICVGPPDFAPDRRPFLSLADDLADRDLPLQVVTGRDDTLVQRDLADLFQRIWETASLVNVDAIRARAISDNAEPKRPAKIGRLPYTDERTMRPVDEPYADAKVRALIPDAPVPDSVSLSFTDLVALAHDPLADEDELVDFIFNQAQRLEEMVRPAYGAFDELSSGRVPSAGFRDPRIRRDQMHDMRMPPYMRDEMSTALGFTRRQYRELIDYLRHVNPPAEAGTAKKGGRAASADRSVPSSPLRRRVAQRLRLAASATAPARDAERDKS